MIRTSAGRDFHTRLKPACSELHQVGAQAGGAKFQPTIPSCQAVVSHFMPGAHTSHPRTGHKPWWEGPCFHLSLLRMAISSVRSHLISSCWPSSTREFAKTTARGPNIDPNSRAPFIRTPAKRTPNFWKQPQQHGVLSGSWQLQSRRPRSKSPASSKSRAGRFGRC